MGESLPTLASELGGDIGKTLLSHALPVAAHAVSNVQQEYDRLSERESYYRRVNIDKPTPLGDSMQVILDRRLANDPELFWGPFMQLGTYLEIENPLLRFGVDLLTDPLTYVPIEAGLGLFKLNKIGESAKVLSAITRGGRVAMTPEKAIGKLTTVLDFFGRMAGKPELAERLLKSSGKLLPGEFKGLINEVKALELPEHYKEMIDVIGKNRKALSSIIKLSENPELGGRALGARDLLQSTFRSQLAAGQRTILEIGKPFPRVAAWIGHPYRDNVLWRPGIPSMFMGKGAAEGLAREGERAVAGSLHPSFDLEKSFKPNDALAGDVDFDYYDLAASDIEVTRLPEGGQLIHGDAVSDESIVSSFNRVRGTKYAATDKEFIQSAPFQEYAKEYRETFEMDQAIKAEFNSKRRQAAMANHNLALGKKLLEIGQTQGLGPAELAAEIGDRLGGTKVARASMTAKAIAGDSRGFDLGIAGAMKLQRWIAQRLVQTGQALMAKNIAKASERERYLPVMRAMWEHGEELFRINDAGHAVLTATPQEVEAFAPIFSAHLTQYPDVEAHLRQVGAAPELAQVAVRTIKLLENLGTQYITVDHLIPEMVGNYVSRAGRFTRKGRKALGMDPSALDSELGLAILGDSTEPEHVLAGIQQASRGGEVKMSVAELRRRTEKQLLGMTRKGYYIPKADPFAVLGEYVDSTTMGLLNNQLFTKLPGMVGPVTLGHADKMKAFGIPEAVVSDLMGKPILTKERPAQKALQWYTELAPAQRFFVPTIEQAAELSNLKHGLPPSAEALVGKTEVGGVKVLSKAVAGTPAAKGASVDPGFVESVLGKAGTGKPGLTSAEREYRAGAVAVPGRIIAYRSPDGSPVAVALLATDKHGKLAIKDLAARKESGLLAGRAVAAVLKEAKRIGASIAEGSLSEDALRLIRDKRSGVTESIRASIVGAAAVEPRPVKLQAEWLRTGSYPDSIANVKAVKAGVKREVAELSKKAEEAVIARLADVTEGGRTIGKPTYLDSVWILKPFAREINEAFRYWSKEGLQSLAGWRLFDNINAGLKSWQLAYDFFHGNVLAAASMMLNPKRMVEVLMLPREVFKGGVVGARLAATRFLPRTAAGAFAGLGATAALGGEDEDELLVGAGLGAVWINAITAAMRNGILNQKALLTPGTSKAMAYAGLAGWNGRPNDRSIGVIGRALKSMADGLREKHGETLLVHAIDGVRRVDDGFNQALWEVIHNGAKMTYFNSRFIEAERRLIAKGGARKLVEGIDQDLLKDSTEIMQAADQFFGGQNYARLYADPQMQIHLQRGLLSQDWTSARLLGAANMMLNLSTPAVLASSALAGTVFEAASNGFDLDKMTAKGGVVGGAFGLLLQKWAQRVNSRMMTKGDLLARESRKLYTAALVGGYFIGNLLNYAFTGHYMWDNAEGDKLKIVMSDGTKIGYGKAYKEAFEFTGADVHFGVPLFSRVSTKLSPAIKLGVELLTNTTWNGPIVEADSGLFTGAGRTTATQWSNGALGSWVSYLAASLTPISAAGPTREAAAVFSGNRDVGTALVSGALRGLGIGVNPPKASASAAISSGLGMLGGLPSIGSAGLSSLLTSQRNLH